MNDPIRELWAQCVVKHTKTPMNWQDVADEFAELIVRECALTLESITVPVFESVEDFDNGYNKALLTGSTVIKKHFGVKQ